MLPFHCVTLKKSDDKDIITVSMRNLMVDEFSLNVTCRPIIAAVNKTVSNKYEWVGGKFMNKPLFMSATWYIPNVYYLYDIGMLTCSQL